MLANQTRSCDVKSETRHSQRAPLSVHAHQRGHGGVPGPGSHYDLVELRFNGPAPVLARLGSTYRRSASFRMGTLAAPPRSTSSSSARFDKLPRTTQPGRCNPRRFTGDNDGVHAQSECGPPHADRPELDGPESAAWLAGLGALRPPDDHTDRGRDDPGRRRPLRPTDAAGRRNAVDAAMRDALLAAMATAEWNPLLQVEISGDGPASPRAGTSTSSAPRWFAGCPEGAVRRRVRVAAATVTPGMVSPSWGPTTWTIPCSVSPSECSRMPNSAQLRRNVSTWSRLTGSAMGRSCAIVGALWSSVAMVRSGRRTRRPAWRSPQRAPPDGTARAPICTPFMTSTFLYDEERF